MSKEAMELALDALGEFVTDYHSEDGMNSMKNYARKHHVAITALREALAAQQEPVGYIDVETLRRWDSLRGTEYECDEKCYMPFSRNAPHKSEFHDCSLAVYIRPQTPAQQEPVAWMHEWEDGERIPHLYPRDKRKMDKPVSVRPLVYADTEGNTWKQL